MRFLAIFVLNLDTRNLKKLLFFFKFAKINTCEIWEIVIRENKSTQKFIHAKMYPNKVRQLSCVMCAVLWDHIMSISFDISKLLWKKICTKVLGGPTSFSIGGVT